MHLLANRNMKHWFRDYAVSIMKDKVNDNNYIFQYFATNLKFNCCHLHLYEIYTLITI